MTSTIITKKKRESKTSQRIFLDFVIICFKKFKEPISFFFFLVFFFSTAKNVGWKSNDDNDVNPLEKTIHEFH